MKLTDFFSSSKATNTKKEIKEEINEDDNLPSFSSTIKDIPSERRKRAEKRKSSKAPKTTAKKRPRKHEINHSKPSKLITDFIKR